MKTLILTSLIFLIGCSSTKTISINSSTVLNANERVDWAITNQDSIVDFRKAGNRYAEIVGNKLFFFDGKDSITTYEIAEFRTIHTFEKAPVIPSIIVVGIILSYSIFLSFFSGMSM